MYFWIIIAVLVAAVDQISKVLISSNFSLSDHFTFIPGLIDIVYVENTGAAFSMFNNFTWLLGIISVLFSVAIVVYMLKVKPTDRLTVVSAGLLLGGALGNGIDRIIRQFVVDFIEITLFKFPVFNIADIAITVGAVLIIFDVIILEKRNKNGENSADI